MTKKEKLAIAEHIRSIASGMTYNGSNSEGCAKHKLYELAMVLTVDAHAMAPSIAQSIRDAAISGNLDNMGNVEFDICTAFSNEDDWVHWSSPCYFQQDSGLQHHARTFMLLVAEALE